MDFRMYDDPDRRIAKKYTQIQMKRAKKYKKAGCAHESCLIANVKYTVFRNMGLRKIGLTTPSNYPRIGQIEVKFPT